MTSNTDRFPGDPGTKKTLFGLNTDGGNPATRETFFGKAVGVYRSYWQANQIDSAVAVAVRDITAGRVPVMSFKVPGLWAAMASGVWDSWFTDLFTKLSTVGGPVWVCFHHEPFDDRTGYGDSCGTAADYTAMYRRAYPFKPANVAIVPILQSAPFDPSVYGHQDILPWYDVNACDIVGIDAYNHWSPPNVNRWRDVSEFNDFFDTLKAKFNKPIALCEWGVRTDPATPGKAAGWMANLRAVLCARGDVVAMSFFDSSQHVDDGGNPWTLDYDGDTERLDQFKTILSGA